MPYDKTLKKYFEDSITDDVEIIRYIDITQVPIEDILDHVLNFWDRENYSIGFVCNLQFEMLLVSLKSAGFFWKPYGISTHGYFAIGSTKEEFMNVITSNFDHINKDSEVTELFGIPRDHKPDKDTVREELVNIKKQLIEKEIVKLQKN